MNDDDDERRERNEDIKSVSEWKSLNAFFPFSLSEAFVPWNLIIVFIAVTEKLQRDATKIMNVFFPDDGEDKNYESCWNEVVVKLVKCISYKCGCLGCL